MASKSGGEHGGGLTSWFEATMPEQYESLVNIFLPGFSGEYGIPAAPDPLASAQMGANVLFSSWLVCFALIIFAVLGRASLNSIASKEGTKRYYADEKLSMRNVFEIYVGAIHGLSDSLVGRKNTKLFFWFFAGVFMYIAANNLVGLLPGAVSASQSMSNNLAIGLTVVVFFTIIGFQRQKMGFLKHMMGPVWYLAPLIFVIEMFSTFIVRPGSLSLRLAGNMNGDHAVLGVTYQFAEYFLPTAALALGTFVSFVQAFVFTLLTMIYVVFSLEHDDH